jgi:chemotaxis protein MotB
MADEEAVRPIIIKKRKVMAGGHHGGAWKVAYADFVTAMMAFFMVMWLVASVNKEQRAALFEYFNNPSMEEGKSTKAAPGQNGPGGASTSAINLGGGLDAPRSSNGKENGLGEPTNAEVAKKIADEEERKKLEELMKQLQEAIEKSQALAPFKDQLLLDISPDGLRLQIVDKQNRAMFDSGKAELKDYTVKILRELAPFLTRVPNMISISGHTDAKPYGSATGGYSNWELSTDRANAARRELVRGGYPEEKMSRVVGLASSALFVKDDPLSPINRRISIVAMTRKAAETALATDAPPMAAPPADAAPSTEAAPPAATQTTLPQADVLPVAAAAPAAAAPASQGALALAAARARAAIRAQAAQSQNAAPKPVAAPTASPSAPAQTPPAAAPAPAAQPARPAKSPAG